MRITVLQYQKGDSYADIRNKMSHVTGGYAYRVQSARVVHDYNEKEGGKAFKDTAPSLCEFACAIIIRTRRNHLKTLLE